MESVKETARKAYPASQFALQREQKGTGDAVRAGMEALPDFDGEVLVVYGDTPLLTPDTLNTLLQRKKEQGACVALLGMRPSDPTGYGRLVMQKADYVERIVECRDATAAEKALPWVWGGGMAFNAEFLRRGLSGLTPSARTQEYYLTALVEMAAAEGEPALMVPMGVEEAMGINTRAQLAEAEAVMQQRLRTRAQAEGATLVDPASVFLAADTKLGQDVVVQPFVTFGPGVVIGDGAEIRSFSHIEGAHVGADAVIGPFARLRPGTVLDAEVHVGNFVELKQTQVARGAKINHLSYVGDAEIGEAVNIGAGTITCNYDGLHKHRTVIGAHAFIGSNTSLVAPVAVGEGAVIGAGSVITEDVPADALAVERSGQQVKPGGAKRLRERRRES